MARNRGRALGAIVECSGACAVIIRVHSICRIATMLASMSVGVPVFAAVLEANQSSQYYEMYRAANNLPCVVSI